MIGSDYRAGDAAGGSRSDTLMLVRIDPRTKYISLLSLPRDLHVTIPGYGVDKINAAYSDGGYKLALKTVEDATGVKPNYLVTVDFKGFRDLVDKFHGVYVPVDQRYYHVNVAGQEQYSQVDIPPGYQLLNGTNALAFARYRHTDSDFYRNARQQVFLHAFSQRASSQLHGIGPRPADDAARRGRDGRQERAGDRPQRAAQRADDDRDGDHGLRDQGPRDHVAAERHRGRRRHQLVRGGDAGGDARGGVRVHAPGEHAAAHQLAAGQGHERPQGAQVQAQGRPDHDAADHGQRERHRKVRPPGAARRWGRGATP